MAQHAYLSASGAHRWMVCPPILQFEADSPRRDTAYTLEGTDAHTLAEAKLMQVMGLGDTVEATKNDLSYYNAEMDEATDLFVDLVMEQFNAHDNAEMELEVRVDFSPWVPDGFGTSDVVILSDGVIEVIDLKYGKGVPVDAYQNPQLMLYALGAYNLYDLAYEFTKVRMTVIQPRLDSVSTFEVEVEELLYWAENYVAPRAVQAYEGIGEWNINEDVMRFSPVRAVLRPRAEKNFEVIDKYVSEETALLNEAELAEILHRAKEIKSWIEHVESHALNLVLNGSEVPGFKAVEGRSNRKISDPVKLAKVLGEEGYSQEDIMKPQELKAMGALEKLVGKNHFAELAGDLLFKPAGKPVLVPNTDKRPALNSIESAKADFADL